MHATDRKWPIPNRVKVYSVHAKVLILISHRYSDNSEKFLGVPILNFGYEILLH